MHRGQSRTIYILVGASMSRCPTTFAVAMAQVGVPVDVVSGHPSVGKLCRMPDIDSDISALHGLAHDGEDGPLF